MNPLAELAQFYTWIQIAVAFVFLFCVLFKPKTFWPLIIIGSIIGQGPRFVGYGFYDEFLVGCVVIGALIRIFILSPKRNDNVPPTQQRAIYYLWIGYMIIESIIGMVVNDDLRIARWIIFYGLLGILPLIFYHYDDEFPFPSLRSALTIVAVTTIIYYIAYLAIGLVYDALFPHGRIYSQYLLTGFIWQGTAIAAYPALLATPIALMMFGYEHSFKKILIAWSLVILIIIAGYFYDSRMTHIVMVGCLIPALHKVKFREIIIAIAAFVIIFFAFFANSTLNFGDYSKKLFGSVMFVASDDEEDMDADRKLQLQASIMRVTDNPVTFLFGDGRYSHRFTLIPHIEELYAYYLPDRNLGKPLGTDIEEEDVHEDTTGSFSIFRTTGFSGLLVDTGIVGMILFALNFLYVGMKILKSESRYRLMLSFVLLLAFAWLFANNVTDVIILYLFIMPGGILEKVNQRMLDVEAERSRYCISQ